MPRKKAVKPPLGNKQITYSDTLMAMPGHGILRCCIQTVGEYVLEHATEPIVDGLIIDCRYEETFKRQIILLDTVWQWNPAFINTKWGTQGEIPAV